MPDPAWQDTALLEVASAWSAADPAGLRVSKVLRETFDQLYDGQRTGRYSWDQLFKTEKTHFGTLLEINLRREFDGLIEDGEVLDYKIRGHDIDCKYSFRMGAWMLPPECTGQLLLVCSASDERSEWAIGVVRATERHLSLGRNRDAKRTLNRFGREAVAWLHWGAELPPNVLLGLDPMLRASILGLRSGQQRINQLFRSVINTRIGRNTVATVAQQDDYMKRVRYNGGARSALAPEGILIMGGDYESHRAVAQSLGCEVPRPGEFVSVYVRPAVGDEPYIALISGTAWVQCDSVDRAGPAPMLPRV